MQTDNPTPEAAMVERTPAQFFFEIGFGAAFAKALIANNMQMPFEFSDAVVEREWEISGEAYEDPEEFDTYLARANGASPPPVTGGQGALPVAYMRRWAFDKNEGTKGNRPRGWKLHAVTEIKCLDDDVPLFATPATGGTFADGVEAAGQAQANLVRQAEHDREARRRAEEAFDLIAPFVAKFAAAAAHYDGGRPRFEGSTTFFHDADPSYGCALTSTATGLGGPGAPRSPTIGDLRLLAAAWKEAAAIRALQAGAGREDGAAKTLPDVIAEAKKTLRLVQSCLECNADDERRWAETIEWLERLA